MRMINLFLEITGILVRGRLQKRRSSVRANIFSEYLRKRRVEKIKRMKGALKFDRSAEEIRHGRY